MSGTDDNEGIEPPKTRARGSEIDDEGIVRVDILPISAGYVRCCKAEDARRLPIIGLARFGDGWRSVYLDSEGVPRYVINPDVVKPGQGLD